MIFALLTLVASLALAAVAGWFSIFGLMAILAGQPIAALVLGATLELGKLVTTSWLYRNWDNASWKLKGPLIYFTFALMLATSMGVFGFLSKAHLEQGAPTMDNASKIERINQQIVREKSLIADNDKVIQQLDATINSFLTKDRADRALSVRRSQAAQRKQLKNDSDATQKHIETLNDEKFKLESDLRKLQLEVGPIRYIAELIYGSEKSDSKTLESAVRIFTLIIVSTLDPLAVTLLIAANFTLLKLQNEKEKNRKIPKEEVRIVGHTLGSETKADKVLPEMDKEELFTVAKASVEREELIREDAAGSTEGEEIPMVAPIFHTVMENRIDDPVECVLEKEKENESIDLVLIDPILIHNYNEHKDEIQMSEEQEKYEEENPTLEDIQGIRQAPLPFIHQPAPSRVSVQHEVIEQDTSTEENKPIATLPIQIPVGNSMVTPWAVQESILRELIGNAPHFIPQKINEEETKENVLSEAGSAESKTEAPSDSESESTVDLEVEESQMDMVEIPAISNSAEILEETHKYPKALSWVDEFKRY